MKKQDIAARLARKTRLSHGAAADRLDRLIHEILTELKRGNPVPLPGLGTFQPGKRIEFQFDETNPKSGGRRGRKR
jgi:nucleoid DNA-binding protein